MTHPTIRIREVIPDYTAAHLYEIEAETQDGERVTLQVEADSRSYARHMAERNGFEVRSVNMVG